MDSRQAEVEALLEEEVEAVAEAVALLMAAPHKMTLHCYPHHHHF